MNGLPVIISVTATQRGFGSDPYKHVTRLTPGERDHVKAGGTVIFRSSRLSGGNSGTYWRTVKYSKEYGYAPRCVERAVVEGTGNTF